MHFVDVADGLSVDRDADVARQEATARGGLPWLDLHDVDPAVDGELEPARQPLGQGADLAGKTEGAAAHAPDRHQLADHPTRRVDRHREGKPLRAEDDHGVDPDDARVRVDERAAGVAGVERDVGLQDRIDESSILCPHAARERADDACRDGVAEAERIADRDDELPDAQRGRRA